jgi:ribonuclease J
VALRDRRMLSADGILIVVATVSAQNGSSVVPPEVLARGVPFITDENDQFVDELREAVEDALDRAAEQRIADIEPLQQLLHDDLAAFIYDRIKRRPMVLPVVVEV